MKAEIAAFVGGFVGAALILLALGCVLFGARVGW